MDKLENLWIKKKKTPQVHTCMSMYVQLSVQCASFDLCIWSGISSLLFKNLFVVLLSIQRAGSKHGLKCYRIPLSG